MMRAYNISQQTIKLLSLVFVVVAATACQKQKVQRQDHQAAQRQNLQPFTEEVLSPQSESLKIFYDQRFEWDQKISEADFDIYQEIILPLEPYFLNPSYVAYSGHNTLPEMQGLRGVFHRALLELVNRQHPKVTTHNYEENILFLYIRANLADCQVAGQPCAGIRFLKGESTSYQVVLKAMDLLENQLSQRSLSLEERQKLKSQILDFIFLAMELRGRQRNLRLDRMAMKYMNDSEATGGSEVARNSLLAARIKAVDVLLETYDQEGIDNGEYREFLSYFEPLEYSRLRRSEQGANAERIFMLAVEHLLPDPEEAKNIIQSAVEKELGRGVSDSPYVRAMEVLKSKYPEILRLVEIQDLSISKHPYFLAIDRVFQGHWSIEETVAYWSSLSLGVCESGSCSLQEHEMALLSESERYIKTQILHTTVMTTQYLKNRFFERDESMNGRLAHVLNMSQQVHRDWMEVLQRVNQVKSFLDLAFHRGRNRRESVHAVAVRNMEAVRDNIKILVTYPTMLIYNYLARGYQMDNRLDVWGGWRSGVQLNKATPYQILIGREAPWFLMGTDGESINTVQALFAVYYLMKLQLTDIYSREEVDSREASSDEPLNQDGRSGQSVSVENIFYFVMEDLFRDVQENLETRIRSIEQRFGRQGASDFQRLCRQIDAGETVYISMYFEVLADSLILGQRLGGVMAPLLSIYRGSSTSFSGIATDSLPGILNSQRRNVKDRMQLIESMRNAYDGYLSERVRVGLTTQVDRVERLEAMESQIAEKLSSLHNLRRDIYGRAIDLTLETRNCVYSLYEAEHQIQKFVRQRLDQYFQNVYYKMGEKQGLSTEDINVRGAHYDPSLPVGIDGVSNYSGHPEMISTHTYRMSKVDILLKVKEILEKASEEGLIQVDLGNGKILPFSFDISLPHNLLEIDMVRRPGNTDIATVSWTSSYSDFKNNAFQTMFRESGTGTSAKYILGWIEQAYSLEFAQMRLSALRELLLSGKVERFTQVCPRSEYESCSKNYFTLSLEDLHKEFDYIRRFIHLDLQDAELVDFINALGRSSLVPIDDIRSLFFDTNRSEPLTLMEKFFYEVFDETLPRLRLGAGDELLSRGLGKYSRDYRSLRDLQEFFIRPGADFRLLIRDQYRREIMEILHPLVSTLQKVEDYNSSNPQIPELIYDINNRSISFIGVNGQVQLVDQRAIDDFKRHMRSNFFVNTDCYFNRRSGEQALVGEELIESYLTINSERCR